MESIPFWFKSKQRNFSKETEQRFNWIKRSFSVADNIIVYGSEFILEDAEKDHKINLLKLCEKCKEQHIKLNNDKAVVKLSEIKFMRHLISSKSVEADPSKIEAIVKISSPTNVFGVKRFCGMVQYLASFLTNLANDLEPIRKLICKGNNSHTVRRFNFPRESYNNFIRSNI